MEKGGLILQRDGQSTFQPPQKEKKEDREYVYIYPCYKKRYKGDSHLITWGCQKIPSKRRESEKKERRKKEREKRRRGEGERKEERYRTVLYLTHPHRHTHRHTLIADT